MNSIEFEDIITLDNKQYVVTSKINYQGKDYIYIVDIIDNTNIKFAEVHNNGTQIYVSEINSQEQELLNAIIPLFAKDCCTIFENSENA